jgi:hypothetical protein
MARTATSCCEPESGMKWELYADKPNQGPLERAMNLSAFYRWNSGNLLENRTRGAFAEWLVHEALGIESEFREEWAPVDAVINGITMEIKSAAFEQSWEQAAPTRIVFPISQRVAQLYVFCLLSGREPDDTSTWTFWVVPTTALPKQDSISLEPLKALAGESVSYEELAAGILGAPPDRPR